MAISIRNYTRSEVLKAGFGTILLDRPTPLRDPTHAMPQNTLADILDRVSPSLIGTAKAVVKSFIE